MADLVCGHCLGFFTVDNALDGHSHVDAMIVHGCTGTFAVPDFNLLFETVTQICRDDSWLKEK